jgi:vacuolar-type H+-ATPase subunit E/Vma4
MIDIIKLNILWNDGCVSMYLNVKRRSRITAESFSRLSKLRKLFVVPWSEGISDSGGVKVDEANPRSFLDLEVSGPQAGHIVHFHIKRIE